MESLSRSFAGQGREVALVTIEMFYSFSPLARSIMKYQLRPEGTPVMRRKREGQGIGLRQADAGSSVETGF